MLKPTVFCTAAVIALNVVTPVYAGQFNPREFPDTPELNWNIDGPVDPVKFAAAKSINRAVDRYRTLPSRMFEWTLDEVASEEDKGRALAGFELGGMGHDLLTSIVTWLSTTFDLPPIFHHPLVASKPVVRLTALDFGALADGGRGGAVSLLGTYEDSKRTLFVPEGWTGGTREEQSILVHQMVYHLQNLAGMKNGCPRERAKLAYVAQEQWLGLSGQNLEVSFGIDPATFLFRTECHIP